MKVLWIGGSHPRHLYFAERLHREIGLYGAIIEERENIVPNPPNNLAQRDRANFILHFKNRELCERKYFGNPNAPLCKTLSVKKNELNSAFTAEFVLGINPDIVMIFGSGLIKPPLMDVLPVHSINLHLGLSPRYRGAATLFWPFYFLEPNHAGSTFHYIVKESDAGDVIHQTIPDLSVEDRIHDVACKTVVSSTQDACQLLKNFEANKKWNRYSQKSTGKLFLERDFRPEHLRINYDLFEDRMVREFISENLMVPPPRLLRQF